VGLETGNFGFKPISRHKNELKVSAKFSRNMSWKLPKEFDYYCPGCLHQTNEYSKRCPECKKQRLLKTEEEGAKEFITDDWYLENEVSKYFVSIMLSISLIFFIIYLITMKFGALFFSIFWTLITFTIAIFLSRIDSIRKNMYINSYKTNNYLIIDSIEIALRDQKVRFRKLGASNWLTSLPMFFSETFEIFGQDLLIKVQRENQGYTTVMVGPVKQSNKKYVEDMKKILNIAFKEIE